MRIASASLALAVTACSPQAKPDVSALLEPCPIAEPTKYTAHETVRIANSRKAALIECNKDKAKIREKLNLPKMEST